MLDVLPMSQTALVKWHSYTSDQQAMLIQDLGEAMNDPVKASFFEKIAEIRFKVPSGYKTVEVRLIRHKQGIYALASLNGCIAYVLDLFTNEEMLSSYTH